MPPGSNLAAVTNRPSLELITPHIGCSRSGNSDKLRASQTFSRFALIPPRRALHGAGRTVLGGDLARRAVPVFLMPAVGLTLRLPQRIGTPSDLLVLLSIHGNYPHIMRLTLSSAAAKLPLVCSRGRLVCCTLRPDLDESAPAEKLLWLPACGRGSPIPGSVQAHAVVPTFGREPKLGRMVSATTAFGAKLLPLITG